MTQAPWFRGGKFKVRYRLPMQRYDRECVAVYLGRSHTSSKDRPFQFSARPDYGTFSLEKDQIISNERVSDDQPCYMDRRAPATES